MKQLSKWSRHTTMQAKFNFSRYHVLVMANVLWFGTLLFTLVWGESNWLLSITANLLFLPFLCFPLQEKSNTPPAGNDPCRQKLLYFQLALLFTLLIVYGITTNKVPKQDLSSFASAGMALAVQPDLPETDPSTSLFKISLRKNITAIGKWANHEIQELKNLLKPEENKKKVSDGKVALIILTLLISFFLSILFIGHVSAASVFNNSPALGMFGLLGFVAIIWLTVIIIRNILNRKDPKLKNTQ